MLRIAHIALLSGLLNACTWGVDDHHSNDADYTAPLPSGHPIYTSTGATPKWENRTRAGNPTTYTIRGITYNVYPYSRGYYRRGVASWYGKKFHGRPTSNGETYNMYDFTAAHKTLPIPCYARVTNLDNGKQIVVRINDRGPFVDDRIIDLSYAAANTLGMVNKGIANVIVETIDTEPLGYVPAHKSVIAGPDREYTQPTVTTYTPEPEPQWEMDTEWQPEPIATPAEPETLSLDYALDTPTTPPAELALDYQLEPEPESIPAPEPTPEATPTSIATITASAPPSPAANTRTEYYMQAGAYQDYSRAAKLYAQMHNISSHTPFITTSGNTERPNYRVLIGPFNSADQARSTATQLASKGVTGGFVVTQ